MIVVTNAGPLMALAKVGAIDLLPILFPGCIVPAAVYDEVVIAGLKTMRPDALAVDAAVKSGKLDVLPVADSDLPPEIQDLPLDRGERHVIHLARVRLADLVLLDDSRARSIAASLGLRVKGTLGVIIAAYRSGSLTRDDAVRIVTAIRSRPDIWIADAVCDAVLAELNSA